MPKVITAPKPKAPLPKALAGSSLLTDVIINKYQYHCPLYRQSKIFASYGAQLPDNTLGNWTLQTANQLMPYLLEPLWQAALSSPYLQIDETPVTIQTENKKGYLWAYLAPYAGQGLVLFDLSLTRSSSVPETRLSHFKGIIQTDGYGGYNNLRKRPDITSCGCLTHSRRKFVEVVKITQDKHGIAAEFIERVKPLYALEARMRQLQLNHHSRKRLRQKQAWPIIKILFPWLKKQFTQVLPKSKLGQAIYYTLNQWPSITAYLRHGMAEIDTNFIENEIRPVALGRKNWLIMNNKNSGGVHAFWFSLIASALKNQLNPRIYIHFLIAHIHEIRKKEIKPEKILPHTINKALLQEFSNKQDELAKKIFDSS